jgi:hypothetical protein
VCHQTVSLIARYLEAEGLPTLCLGSAHDILFAARPPRSVFVDYPLGHSAGRPFDAGDQQQVLNSALHAFEGITEPGEIVRLDNRWPDDSDWKAAAADSGKGDTRQPRDTTPRYQTEEDRVLAEAGSL